MSSSLSQDASKGARVRAMLARREAVAVPGTHDALGAMLIEAAGFEAVYISGYCVAASRGKPDIGLISGSEMIAQAAQIVAAVDLPVIADADTGYGDVSNIAETVRALERAGVAAMHLEDQMSPKRCGAMSGKALVDDAEMAGRLRAALLARRSPDFLVIGRTDAVALHGVGEAIRRLKAMAELGVDAVMVPSLSSLDECRAVAEAVNVPVIHTVAETIRPLHPQRELAQTGLGMSLYPITLIQGIVGWQRALLERLREEGSTAAMVPDMAPLAQITEMLGASHYAAFERQVVKGA
ncbi:isocitrate lyase/phosphoenolpyruvate mutase family protein [Caballeronia sp. LZ065]|uniref:isocitrate lyase/PEP mutase family protein n=1 Tax=Caballeronia sp. LZ065 TaxID=3038571 RepID=UPI00285A0E46|nr:isocitrate lyase/phosphoenolpyruvate mutase family protein [Caballeronia sp. LZ065]MDR5781406.1 isocitrate lyase/phosphoenolpyruvate mutase family protein [Caballeronia sp. LZ065]